MDRAERIKQALQPLEPIRLELTDDSAKHAGHAGARRGGESHYHLIIESARFTGLSKVKRHQLIYQLLAEEFQNGLHALSMETYAPGEKA